MPAPAANAPRILFMDDESDIRKIGERVLTYLGYRATTVAEGQAALTAYEEAMQTGDPFAATILDLTIHGGMDGSETQQRLRALDPKVKSIVSTGHSVGNVTTEYAAHGFVGTISKPYEISTLKRVLDEVLAAS